MMAMSMCYPATSFRRSASVIFSRLKNNSKPQSVIWDSGWSRMPRTIKTANDILMDAVKKYHAAGLLSQAGLDAVLAR
jgi:hypothetical protein